MSEFDEPKHDPALTHEEWQVLQLVVWGESDKRIARALGLRSATVASNVVCRIREEFGAVNRTHLAALAVHAGLRP
jgi:DNA-binding NarL/FixJ family response regulator